MGLEGEDRRKKVRIDAIRKMVERWRRRVLLIGEKEDCLEDQNGEREKTSNEEENGWRGDAWEDKLFILAVAERRKGTPLKRGLLAQSEAPDANFRPD